MEKLLTIEEAAARLKVNPETVRRQLRGGKLRGVKRNKLWRVFESALYESVPQNAGHKSSPPPSDSDSQPDELSRDLALLDELDNFVSAIGSPRAAAGLPHLTDEEIFEAIHETD